METTTAGNKVLIDSLCERLSLPKGSTHDDAVNQFGWLQFYLFTPEALEEFYYWFRYNEATGTFESSTEWEE